MLLRYDMNSRESWFDWRGLQGLAAGEGKYPVLSSVYQVAGQPHLFMAGALTHGREAQDDPASTGSSVAAFRYCVACLSSLA